MILPARLFPCLMPLLAACSVPEPAGPSQPIREIIDESKMPVPMRDGVNLATHVYRPDAPGKFPTLMLLRYFRAPFRNEHAEYFAKRGYAVALVDSRGRVARQTVYHNAQYPSHLVLPVIPAGSGD